MNAQAIVAIVACAVVIITTVVGAAWRLGSKLAKMDAKLEPLTGIGDRVLKLEVKVENHEKLFEALYERETSAPH